MDDAAKRIEKLEEALAFTDRDTDQLGEQIIEAFRQIDVLRARLDSIERRLTSVEEFDASDSDESDGGS